jgi:predicted transcriptional regulator
MSTLLELAANIVSSHASVSPMTTEELIQEVVKVHAALVQLESGVSLPERESEVEPAKTALTIKQAFKQNEIICMICNKGGMKTLSRHLTQAHQMKPREYRKQFGIPAATPLTAKKFSEERKQLAKTINLAGNLAKARETRMANLAARKAAPAVAGKAVRRIKK